MPSASAGGRPRRPQGCTDAAAKLAELGTDYGVEYIEPELTLRQELLMQLRTETLRLGEIAGLAAPRSDVDGFCSIRCSSRRAPSRDSMIPAGCMPTAGAANPA